MGATYYIVASQKLHRTGTAIIRDPDAIWTHPNGWQPDVIIGYQAWCQTCRWKFPLRELHGEATTDHLQHRRDTAS